MEFTDQEKAILRIIQSDAGLPLARIAESVGMAQSTVWRKVQEFEALGLIDRRVTLLNPKKAGVGLCVLAQIRMRSHTQEAVDGFIAMVRRHPEILECHAISGSADYFIKVRVADVEAYEHFMSHNLLRSDLVKTVVSNFVLKEIKHATELPL
ncbi:Lrp/AsnC family transcriptional regulator [Neptunicoccus cionae]|uniref:AsnC family transcriptional regulator n=1 Tax=Neptunicoccus cionae TaxID=2035344 RepID=A0A916VMJ2_9RHOB|nr:Lrp/AsnC family transcriptional regulator [Amylibacter cionae]GGA06491.1 AsnC family transcriptional regulator [Amylibacter cionae]